MAISDYDDVFDSAAKEWNVDPDMLRAVATQESGGDPNAKSKAGASGLMQIMPGTAKDLGVTNPRDPVQSIYGGAKYLSQLLDKYGKPETALAAYNAGPQRVDDALAGRGTLPAETQAYVPAVAAHYKSITAAAQPATAPVQPSPQAAPAQAKPNLSDMSDADFLKATMGAPAEEPDDSFLKRTGGQVTPPTEAAVPGTPAQTDKEGFITAPGTPATPAQSANEVVYDGDGNALSLPSGNAGPTAREFASNVASGVGGVIGDAARGAAEGYGTQPVVTVPTSTLQNIGMINKPGEHNLLKSANEALINGGASAADMALRGGSALFRGAQAGVASAGAAAGAPLLGRDLAAIPEAFMGSPSMLHPGMPPEAAPVAAGNELAAVDRPYLSPSFADNPVAPGAQAAIEQARTVPANPLAVSQEAAPVAAGNGLVAPGPASAVPGVEQPTAPSAPPEPNSVGAAATPPADIVPLTAAQKAANLQKMVNQSAEDRLTPSGRDDNVYVQGVERPEVMKNFAPAAEGEVSTSVQHKVDYNTDSNYHDNYDAIVKKNNDIMNDKLGDLIGDANSREDAMKNARSLMPGSVGLFDDQKPVDLSPVADTINRILSSGAGKVDGVVNTLKKILPKLNDSAGNLETMPSQIKGILDDVNNKLYDKSPTTEGNDARIASNQLREVKDALSSVIGSGLPAGKWDAYNSNLSAALGQVNKQDYLQQYLTGTKKLTNRSGDLQFGKVDNMLQDIQKHNGDNTGGAKELSDDEINTIESVRNELAAKDLLEKRGSVRGSPTAQIQNAAGILGSGALGAAVRHGSVMATHAAIAASPLAGWGNAALGAYQGIVKPAMKAGAETRAANALIERKRINLDTSPNPNALIQ